MSTASGKKAEERVARFLREHEFKIRERNWRTRWCEIDIVAEKEDKIHFVEVKYRRDSRYGVGYEFVTPARLSHMRRAALQWTAGNDWGGDYCIDVASVDGDSGEIDYIEDVAVA